MFKKTDAAKLELISKYISDIERIIERHGSAGQMLDDYEGEYAVMMCLTQIAETVNKITDADILEKIKSPGIISFRNRLIHNYEGRDKTIILSILENNIPELKNIISDLIKEINN